MLVVCWSPKGGSGTSVVATGLAIASTRRTSESRTVIVDLAGDIPPILAMGDVPLGVAEWIAQPTAFDLSDLLIECSSKLSVLPRGNSALPETTSGAWSRLSLELESMSSKGTTVIVDSGIAPTPHELRPLVMRDYIVIRPCYLALRRARLVEHSSHSAIVVREPNRVLVSADIESVLGLPIAAEVSLTSDVARRIDAGIVSTRPPSSLMKELAPLVEEWSRR